MIAGGMQNKNKVRTEKIKTTPTKKTMKHSVLLVRSLLDFLGSGFPSVLSFLQALEGTADALDQLVEQREVAIDGGGLGVHGGMVRGAPQLVELLHDSRFALEVRALDRQHGNICEQPFQ